MTTHDIGECFRRLQAERRKGLIPFIVAGDPAPRFTVPLMRAMVDWGADVVELGVPFSDPMADGQAIQSASERALAHGVSLRDVMEMVAMFRQTDQRTPVVLMGYMNPIECMGYAEFAERASAVGVDGILVVDAPPEEVSDLKDHLSQHRLDQIFLLSPTTGKDRRRNIVAHASGFLYYVSLKGVTGSEALHIGSVKEHVTMIKQETSLPVVVGFGIKDSESAARIAAVSDAIVVGSAIVTLAEQLAGDTDHAMDAIGAYLTSMRQAIDGVASSAT